MGIEADQADPNDADAMNDLGPKGGGRAKRGGGSLD